MAMKKAHGWKRKKCGKNVKGGGGAEEVEHAESNPTTLNTLLRKWQRYCVIKRLFSFVCVKKGVTSLHCFSFDSISNHPENATRPSSECCRNTRIDCNAFASTQKDNNNIAEIRGSAHVVQRAQIQEAYWKNAYTLQREKINIFRFFMKWMENHNKQARVLRTREWKSATRSLC